MEGEEKNKILEEVAKNRSVALIEIRPFKSSVTLIQKRRKYERVSTMFSQKYLHKCLIQMVVNPRLKTVLLNGSKELLSFFP